MERIVPFFIYNISFVVGRDQLPDATPSQIKKAYYNCMKACHPDLSGDDPETTNFCMFINEVYAVGFSSCNRLPKETLHASAE